MWCNGESRCQSGQTSGFARDLDYNTVEQKGYHAESYTTEGGMQFGSFPKASDASIIFSSHLNR
jgi:hypothetical protein